MDEDKDLCSDAFVDSFEENILNQHKMCVWDNFLLLFYLTFKGTGVNLSENPGRTTSSFKLIGFIKNKSILKEKMKRKQKKVSWLFQRQTLQIG